MLEDIVFIKADGNICHFYLKHNVKNHIRVKIGDVWNKINETGTSDSHHFVKAGRSYIINMNCVTSVDTNKKTVTVYYDDKNINLPGLSKTALNTINEKIKERETNTKLFTFTNSAVKLNQPITSLNKSNPEIGGHKYVDLGLPSGTLWAMSNVNANGSEHAGWIFGKEADFNVDKHEKFMEELDNMEMFTYEEYCLQKMSLKRYIDSIEYWDENYWSVPTTNQWYELFEECKKSLCIINDEEGVLFKGPNGNMMYLPKPLKSSGNDGYKVENFDTREYYLGLDIGISDITPYMHEIDDELPHLHIRLVAQK